MTLPSYRTIDQSEAVHKPITPPGTPPLQLAFKNVFLKPIKELGVLSTSCRGLCAPLGALQNTLHFSSPQPGVSRSALLRVGQQTQVLVQDQLN